MNSDFSVAVHALVYLNHKDCVLSSDELAKNVCTNPARVRKVLARLKGAGLVATHEGNTGGYQLAVDGKSLNLKQIAQAMDARFVSSSWQSGDLEKECLICSGMGQYMEDLWEEMNQLCLSKLEAITVEEIEEQLLARKEKSHEEL